MSVILFLANAICFCVGVGFAGAYFIAGQRTEGLAMLAVSAACAWAAYLVRDGWARILNGDPEA